MAKSPTQPETPERTPEAESSEEPMEVLDPQIEHGGSSVKQGLRGNSSRGQARGRDEFQAQGNAADYDLGRATVGGRHYGRSGGEEPGPGYGRGPLQPEGAVRAPRAPSAPGKPARGRRATRRGR
jgi:hypothetical protein